MPKLPSPQNKFRYRVVCGIFVGLFLFLFGRLFYLQIFRHDYYEGIALDQQTWEVAVEARRGTIRDTNGVELAVSATAYKILLAPSLIKEEADRVFLTENLAQMLEMDYERVYSMASRNVQYVEVKRRVEKEEADLVTEFVKNNNKYAGILWVSEDTKRYYPHNNLLSTVLGFVGSDNQGLEGLEYTYEDYLAGTDGKIIAAKTANGTTMPFEYESYIRAEDGYDLYLTVDIEMQYFLEKHIYNARVEHNVQSRVAGVIMNVKTGEVLAMSSKPDYDPNDPFIINDPLTLDKLTAEYEAGSDEYIQAYNTQQKEFRRNKIIVDMYDPGSTFKIFTSTMALEEDLIDLNETFFCTGTLQMGAVTYHCANRNGHGREDFKLGLANSCNPVFIQIADRIGIERFYNYVTLFGFRDKTNVGLPGESAGNFFRLEDMTKYNIYSASFGQTFQITGMQLIAGVSAIANGGTYMQPYIVKQVVDTAGNVVIKNEPTAVRQLASSETSALLREYLEFTVTKGKTGYLEGYRIAGKTGTSQKAEDGSYENDKRIASFVCFAPADDPVVAVLVIVDEPNSEVQYGSYIAAPLGRDIMADCLQYLNVEPDYGENGSVTEVTVPDVLDLPVDEAAEALEEKGLGVKIIGDGDKVAAQLPGEGKILYTGNTVILYTNSNAEEAETTTKVPLLLGKTAAECNSLLAQAGLNIKVVGENLNYSTTVAAKQSIAPDTTVDKGTVVTVTFGSS